MRRTWMMALCVAAAALSGIGAAGAWALPEVGRCVAKAGGKYKDAGCTIKGAGGTFEFLKNAVKKSFTATGPAGSEAVLETSGGTKITCSSYSATGEYREKGSPPTTKEVHRTQLVLNGCSRGSFAPSCNSKGATRGEIRTAPLSGTLGYIAREKTVTPEVGLELTPETKKGAFAEYSCGSEAVKIKLGEGPGNGHDCVIGAFASANVMSTTNEITFAGTNTQSPAHFEKSPTKTCNLESNPGGTFERTSLSLAAVVSSEEALEIKA
jgi:hypothetical protein